MPARRAKVASGCGSCADRGGHRGLRETEAHSLYWRAIVRTQFLDRLRLAVVLRQVVIDHLAERQRATAASLTAHSFQCPLERLARVACGREPPRCTRLEPRPPSR